MAPQPETGPTQSDGSRYLLGGMSFPMQTEARCRTCRHHRRVDIDAWLLDGTPPSAVAERLGPDAPTQSSIIRHRDRHLPTDLVAREALVRERANGATVSLDDAVEDLVDSRKLARLLAALGMQAITDGRIVPLSFNDVVRATDLLARTEALAGDANEDQVTLHRLSLMRLLRAVEAVVSKDEWDEIGRRMHADEVMKAIDAFETGRETDESKALLDRELAALGPISPVG